MNGSYETDWVIRGLIFASQFLGFLLLFRQFHLLRFLVGVLERTKEYLNENARRHLLDNRLMLQTLRREHSLWFYLEQQLQYSGLKRQFSGLTVEYLLAGNIVLICGIAVSGLLCSRFGMACVGIAVLLLAEWLIFLWRKACMFRSVNENLLKFLDFLGNYSITAQEITGIFQQVSRYVDEPLKGVLDACYYEAQTTGDTAMALLAMAEKIEHPQFKELVRNMEISIRYAADFTLLVQNSRRSVREYLRGGTQRKGLMQEAMVNMLLLLGLSCFIFLTVDRLLERSIWQILLHTLPGKMALGVLAVIFVLFGRQIYRVGQ